MRAVIQLGLATLVLGLGPAAGRARADGAACQSLDWDKGPRQLPLLLGVPKVERGKTLITDFTMAKVAPSPAAVGSGGITGEESAIRSGLGNCSDSPSGGQDHAQAGARFEDARTGLAVEVTAVEPAGKSGRKWDGVRCSYRISAKDDPAQYVTLGPESVPAFNALSGLQRDGAAAFATLQWNGYAKEIQNKGNVVLGLDLCAHRVVWRSRDLASNAALLLHHDYLVTGYGFTKERAALYVLNRWTGNPAQLIALPKSPSDLRVQDGTLFVRLYDGYAAFPLNVK